MKKGYNEKNTKKILVLIFVLITVISFGVIQIIAASSPTPGSNQDPIVTKSYVDMKISQILSSIGTSTSTTTTSTITADTSELESQIAALEKKIKVIEQDLVSSSSTISIALEENKFNVVQLFKGQSMLTGEGTEFLLRAGTATSIAGPGGDMSDLTTGINMGTGDKLVINHLMISSRDDGRGLKVTSDTAWFLVKGTYKVTSD